MLPLRKMFVFLFPIDGLYISNQWNETEKHNLFFKKRVISNCILYIFCSSDKLVSCTEKEYVNQCNASWMLF
jgi:hypothetical protein